MPTSAEPRTPFSTRPKPDVPRLRADAARNRARILAAAAEVFAQRGLDVNLDDIAKHAGVGVGTIYRRFADREELVEAVFDARMSSELQRLQDALDDPDPGHGLFGFFEQTCMLLASDRGMRQVMLSSAHGRADVARRREEFRLKVGLLVTRAQDAGLLDAGIDTSDFPVLLMMVSTVADFAGDQAPQLWRRYFDMIVAGMQPGAARPGTPAALDHSQLLHAMDHWRPACQ